MRLINTKTWLMEEFWGGPAPSYAILSHRWEAEEVSLRDWRKATKKGSLSPEHLRSRRGFRKVSRFCEYARTMGHGYVWVDTCCIDKSSSAELQEAINSMFRWYKSAQCCYAYLFDWPPRPGEARKDAITDCEWFSRGWTLQELLAPGDVIFLNREWESCGSRTDFAHEILTTTGIRKAHLSYSPETNPSKLFWWVTIAERMMWASRRRTTRVEDRAYSLLGLFGIHMPMLYGEAEQAFRRLQEEIIKVEEDCSILAWRSLPGDTGFAPCALATSPDHFFPHGLFSTGNAGQFEQSPLTMIQRGLLVPLLVRRDSNDPILGYVVLHSDFDSSVPSTTTYSLVLPILFSKGDLYSFDVGNECIRISDPILLQKTFMTGAKREQVCFLREPLGVRPTIGFEIRLKKDVWRCFEVIFSYPPQLQAGRQAFPILMHKCDLSQQRRTGYLVVGLRSRTDADRRALVVAEYMTCDGQVGGLSVGSFAFPENLDLAMAERLVSRPEQLGSLIPLELPGQGRFVEQRDILDLHPNETFWVRKPDGEI